MLATPIVNLLSTGLRIAGVLALGVLATSALDRLFPPGATHHASAETRINPYGKNPFIASGLPFLFWHRPGAAYVQAIDSHGVDYQINARGFRGLEIAPDPPAGMRRLLLLGDSTVEGAGVAWPDTFASRLANTLRGENWDAATAAMQGASPIYVACNLARYFALHPDTILLVLSENDLIEDRERERGHIFTAPMPHPEMLLNGVGAPAPAIANSLHMLAGQGRVLLSHWLNPGATERTIRENAAAWKRIHPGSVAGWAQPLPQQLREFDASWTLSARYLDRLAEACRARGVSLLVATLNLVPLALDSPEVHDNAARLDRAAAAWAAERGFPFMAITPALLQAAGDQDPRTFVAVDAHLTPAGHALAADVLAPWLRAQLDAQKR